jgi:putative redox protein
MCDMEIHVDHVSGDRFAIAIRGHTLVTDQPVGDGGDDLGPTPTELFVASLAACVGFYARRALRSEATSDEFPKVTCSYTMSASPPPRVETVNINIVVPSGLSDARRAAVCRAVTHCTVHNSIVAPPVVQINVTAGVRPNAVVGAGI